MRGNFRTDLAFGEQAEVLLLEQLVKHFPNSYKATGNEPRWDIVVPEIDKTVEVKYDEKAATTGNFFIECKCSGKDSGIEKTQADVWAIFNGQQWWYTTPTLIRETIEKHKIKPRRFRVVEGYLVPITKMKTTGSLFGEIM